MLSIISLFILAPALVSCLSANLESCKSTCISNFDNEQQDACTGACEFYVLLTDRNYLNPIERCHSSCKTRYTPTFLDACSRGCDYADSPSGISFWVKKHAFRAYEAVKKAWNDSVSFVKKLWCSPNSDERGQTSSAPAQLSPITTKVEIPESTTPVSKETAAKLEELSHQEVASDTNKEKPNHLIWITRLRISFFGPIDHPDTESLGTKEQINADHITNDAGSSGDRISHREHARWIASRVLNPFLLISMIVLVSLTSVFLVLALISRIVKSRLQGEAGDSRLSCMYLRLPKYEELIPIEEEHSEKKSKEPLTV